MAEALLIPYAPFMPRKGGAYNQRPTVPGTLGHFIRVQREARGWSQPEFADHVDDGMIASDVSNLERGRVGLPEPSRMVKIARALGMHVCDLYVEAGFPEFAVTPAVRGKRAEPAPGAPIQILEPDEHGSAVAIVERRPRRRRGSRDTGSPNQPDDA
jgi:transcriptional regulator with XRE-family HTH domain